jgi:hypothetical protein
MADAIDIISNFKAAIMAKFNAIDGDGNHNDYWNSIQGRLYFGRAEEGSDYPYSVYYITSHTPDRTFTEDMRDLLVQFSHFSANKSSSIEVETINAYCNNLFDECAPFEITGATLIWMKFNQSQGAMPEDFITPTSDGGWHCPTDYDVKISID